MATPRRKGTARKNIKKAQARWQSMSKRQRSLAQPQGRGRQKPGTTGQGRFYRIEVRPKGQFTTFRNQDVGKKGGLERVAGKRPSGSWDTVTWLVEKGKAYVDSGGHLVITDPKAKSVLDQVRGPIIHKKGDVFAAKDRKNIPERSKPTPTQRRARTRNIKKAQRSRKKRR